MWTMGLSPVVAKEIRALLPFWGASAAALVAAELMWRGIVLPDAGLFVYIVGSVAIGAHSIGQEYTHGTLPILLSQPIDRRRVYLVKSVVSGVLLLTLAAVAWTLLVDAVMRPESWQVSFVILPALCGLFLAPLFTMIGRSSLAGMILSATVAGSTWLLTLAMAWLAFGIDIAAAEHVLFGRWALGMMAASPLVGWLGWRRFTRIEAIELASPALHWPRWPGRAPGARRHHPLRALAAKDLRLQQLSFAVAGLYLVGWATFLLVQRVTPALSTFPMGAAMLLYCMGLAIMIGALASAEERHHGTLDWQRLQPVPAWQQWMVKIGVTFGVALPFGVGLPVLLIQLTPHDAFRAIQISGDLAVLIVLLTASSLYISSLASTGVHALVLSVPTGIAVAFFVQTVSGALGWVTLTLAGPSMADIVTGAVTPPSVHPADLAVFAARTLSLTLAPLLLWLGFVNHTSSERTARRVLRQIAAIALVIVAGILLVGGLLALHELRAR